MSMQRTHSNQHAGSSVPKRGTRKSESKQAARKKADDLGVRNVADDDDDRGDREKHPTGTREATSGTLASLAERGDGPVADPGVSVDPDDLGSQFLRNATEQDNFESALQAAESELGNVPIGQVTSRATLEAAGQETVDLPESGALHHEHEQDIAERRPASRDVDLTSSVILQGPLFDEQTEKGGTRAPLVEADEMKALDQHDSATANPDERERAKQEARKRLQRSKDRRDIQADTATWQGNRQSPNERSRESSTTPGMKPGARGKRE